jgi:hypothetical protein
MKRGAFVAAVLLLGCGDDPVEPQVSVAGSYAMQTINGNSLPAVAEQNASKKREFMSSTLVLKADKTYSHEQTIRETPLPNGSPSTTTTTCTDLYGAGVDGDDHRDFHIGDDDLQRPHGHRHAIGEQPLDVLGRTANRL